LGWVSAIDCEGRTIWIVDAYRDGKRFIVHADEILTAFLELGSAIRAALIAGYYCRPQASVMLSFAKG
jgi:hypothetical protein